MDIDHYNEFEDDDITVLSQNNSVVTSPIDETSSRQPLSKYYHSRKSDWTCFFFLFIIVPDDCTDDASALESFSHVFNSRYNSTGPILFIGSLDQAIQESLHSSIHNVNKFFFDRIKKNQILLLI